MAEGTNQSSIKESSESSCRNSENNDSFEATSALINELIVMAAGYAGDGRTQINRYILGKNHSEWNPPTRKVSVESCRRDGYDIIMIDTPGFGDIEMQTDEETVKEIKKGLTLTSRGLHCILLVLKFRCLTEARKKTIECLKKLFGHELSKRTIIIFVGGEKFQTQGRSLDEVVECIGPYLANFIKECDGRFVIYNPQTKDSFKTIMKYALSIKQKHGELEKESVEENFRNQLIEQRGNRELINSFEELERKVRSHDSKLKEHDKNFEKIFYQNESSENYAEDTDLGGTLPDSENYAEDIDLGGTLPDSENYAEDTDLGGTLPDSENDAEDIDLGGTLHDSENHDEDTDLG